MDATSPGEGTETDARLWWLSVAVAVTVAVALRWWGIDFGLPMVIHMDEWEQATASLALDEQGMVSGARRWRYPPMLAELISLRARLSQCGVDCTALQRVSFGREVSAVFSAAAAGCVVLAGRQAGLRSLPALTGGLLVAVLPLLTRLGRYATPDALAMSMSAFALLMAMRVATRGMTRDYWLAATFIGLSAAAKYNAGVVAAALVFGAWMYRVRETEAPLGRESLQLLGAAVWSLATFAAVIAIPWHNWADFTGGLALEWKHYVNGHAGFDCTNAAWEALAYLARFGIGPIACLMLIAGLGLAWRNRHSEEKRSTMRRVLPPVASSLLLYGLLLVRQEVFFARLTAPLLPGLSLLLASALHDLTKGDRQGLPSRLRTPLAACCVIALPLTQACMQAYTLSQPDTRLKARDWMHREFVDSGRRFRIAVVPESGRRGQPKALHLRYVKPTTDLHQLRRRRFTHVLYGQGGVDRFNWRPEKYQSELEPYLEFHGQLESEARLVQTWRASKLPGTTHFGDAGVLIHNYTLELWEL